MTETMERELQKIGVTLSKPVLAILAIIFGILVIALPNLLSLIVGIYLIIQGIFLLSEHLELRKR